MSERYPDLPFYSDDEMTLLELANPTDDMMPIINHYQTYLKNKDVTGANQYLADHPEIEKHIITLKFILTLYQSVVAHDRLFKGDVSEYIAKLQDALTSDQFGNATLVSKGLVKLSNDTNSDDETVAATSKAVKNIQSRSVNGYPLSSDITLTASDVGAPSATIPMVFSIYNGGLKVTYDNGK